MLFSHQTGCGLPAEASVFLLLPRVLSLWVETPKTLLQETPLGPGARIFQQMSRMGLVRGSGNIITKKMGSEDWYTLVKD